MLIKCNNCGKITEGTRKKMYCSRICCQQQGRKKDKEESDKLLKEIRKEVKWL